MPQKREQSKPFSAPTIVSTNGTDTAHSVDVESSTPPEEEYTALSAPEQEAPPPWAGNETLDYTKLKAPEFIKPPSAKKSSKINVTCRQPHKQEFIRRYACDQSAIPFRVIRDQIGRNNYFIVPEELSERLEKFWVLATIELVINQDGDLIFVVCPYMDLRGNSNEWWTSLREALATSTDRWVKVLSNMHAGRYEVVEPPLPLEDPEWPDIHWGELFSQALQGKVLSEQHPAMRGFVGGVKR